MNKKIFFSLFVSGLFFLTNFSYGGVRFIVINRTGMKIGVTVNKDNGRRRAWYANNNKAVIFKRTGPYRSVKISGEGMETKILENFDPSNGYKICIIKKNSSNNTFYIDGYIYREGSNINYSQI